MKKITLLILGLLFLLVSPVLAQNLIAVQNGSIPKFYSIISDAFDNAQAKDTIYIPGGAYTFTTPLIIDKELHIIGNGYSPDSTLVGGITLLNTSITIISGANHSTFEGLYFSALYTGTSPANEDVDNITISRCVISPIYLSRLSNNWVFKENVIIGELRGKYLSDGSSAQNNSFQNNIIASQINNFGPNNEFKNNIFLVDYYNNYNFNIIDGCLLENNIIFSTKLSSITSCTFNNNLFFAAFSIPPTCIGSNNITNQTATETFVNQTGNFYSSSDNYHLKLASTGKNAGRDGTDIGIYGGAYPWKEGSIPANPHFQSIKIAPKTDNSGNLNVKIKVAAQDN